MRRFGSTISPRTSVWRRYVLVCAALFAALFILRYQTVLSFLGTLIIDSQPPQHADLILVLGGEFWGPRVIKAADLAALGYAPLVLVSSPPHGAGTEADLTVPFLLERGYRRELIAAFPHNGQNTIAEALQLRAELARRRAKRVLLVTSAYHSRRAAIVFYLFCPGIEFISVPSTESDYSADGWWNRPRSRQLFFSESTKILGTLAIAYPVYLVTRWRIPPQKTAVHSANIAHRRFRQEPLGAALGFVQVGEERS